MKANGTISSAEWTAVIQMTSHLEDIKRHQGEQRVNFEVMTRGVLELLHPQASFALDDAQQVYSRVSLNSAND